MDDTSACQAVQWRRTCRCRTLPSLARISSLQPPLSQHVKADGSRGNREFTASCCRRLLCRGGRVPGPPALSLNPLHEGEAITTHKSAGPMLYKQHGADGPCLQASLSDYWSLAATPALRWQPAALQSTAANPSRPHSFSWLSSWSFFNVPLLGFPREQGKADVTTRCASHGMVVTVPGLTLVLDPNCSIICFAI